jgi:hypothetical protein
MKRTLPLFLSAMLVLAAPAFAEDIAVGFDSVGAPGAFAQIVPGFANGPLLEYATVTLDGAVILSDVLFASGATSGGNIYATCDTCGLGDNPPTGLPGMVTGEFSAPVTSIDLDVINGSTASGGNFMLIAYDGQGAEVDSDSIFATSMGAPGFVQHLAVSGAGIESFTVTTSLTGGYTFAIDTLVYDLPTGSWSDLGQGLAGTNGVPVLTGSGTLQAGAPLTLALTSALENASTALVIGLVQIDAPFKGGVLVPRPDLILFGLTTNAFGVHELPALWPAGAPSGFSVVFQHWVTDPVAPVGFAASNALRATAP